MQEGISPFPLPFSTKTYLLVSGSRLFWQPDLICYVLALAGLRDGISLDLGGVRKGTGQNEQLWDAGPWGAAWAPGQGRGGERLPWGGFLGIVLSRLLIFSGLIPSAIFKYS